MKRYEGLFILNLAGKEEGLKEAVDKVSAEITAGGGKIETVQKMERKQFARVADKRNQSGFYVNVVFETRPQNLASLRDRFRHADDVFRVTFTEAKANAGATLDAPKAA